MTSNFGVCWLFCGVVLVGCGGGTDRPQTYPVTGTVTYNGSPVVGATVGFIPQGGRAASGLTDAQGVFQLQTYDTNDGAIMDTHKITITAAGGASADDPVPSNDPASLQTYEKEMKARLPSKYASIETSGLSREVSDDGQNDFKFDLTD